MLEWLETSKKLLLLIFGFRKRFRVIGSSMIPLLQSGEEILVDTQAYKQIYPQVGDIVIAQLPFQGEKIVKRVAAVLEDGSCFLVGDNYSESTDSRHYGFLRIQNIIGKVTGRFP
ncbi:S26 family signal peptidase [Richelia intracellularis]|nr:S26 family signal peptidase [Richelia intracellularis]HAE05427.1 S26 family signal peptidase [Richelia sp.]